MTPHETVEWLSIIATFPTVALAARVAWMFGRTYRGYYNRVRSHGVAPVQAAKTAAESVPITKLDLMFGVIIGFGKDIGDNLYWLVPWSLSFVGSDMAPTIHSLGVYSNLPVRQGLGIIAAVYHIRRVPGSQWQGYLVWSTVAGILYGAALLLVRS